MPQWVSLALAADCRSNPMSVRSGNGRPLIALRCLLLTLVRYALWPSPRDVLWQQVTILSCDYYQVLIATYSQYRTWRFSSAGICIPYDVRSTIGLLGESYVLVIVAVVRKSTGMTLCTVTVTVRSSDCSLLAVPHVHTCFGFRSFAVAAPTTWNSLPLHIRNSSSIIIIIIRQFIRRCR